MDEEQRKWSHQYSSNLGAREFLRFGCTFLLWLLIGPALSLTLGNVVYFLIFLVGVFVFPFLARRQPAYSLLRLIFGNKNLPYEPMPGGIRKTQSAPRPWWSYLPGIRGWLMFLLLLSFAIKYISK